MSSRATLPTIRSEAVDDFFALFQRADRPAADGPAIHLVDDDILSDVYQTSREVPGVRGLQGSIGEPFPRTVGADEVLQNREPFPEVRGNRGLR